MTPAVRGFPDGFLWGTATAAHQVEGGNWNNDWWAWEHTPGSGCAEPSGDACDHWHRWPQDLRLLADLGFGAYRSRWSGAGSSQRRASSPGWRWTTT
jgi:beta-glucosidase